jgi:energy-coupling factor transporter ATP-binding protein EcfA2
LGLLRKYVRTPSEGDFALLLAFLVAALRPSGPYPVLCLTGEQGTGKSTVTKMIRKLVDPYGMDTRSKPKSPRDLAVGAHNTWLLAFNNLSGIPRWLSDGFCRLSDGSGYGVRKNYEDRDEVVFYHQRPLVLNGIERLATRPDLADRAVRLQLERIPKSERKTESELWAAFDRDRPLILGALFDAVSEALANIDDVHVEEFERMADFSAWAVAAEPAFPTDDGTFLRAYEGNRQEASRETAESNPVASAICEMIEAEGDWTGKTKPLRKDLKSYLPDPKRPPADFPETYQAMGAELRRLLPVLRDLGIEKVDDPRERSRQFTLRQIEGRREANEADEAHATGQRSHKRRSGRAHPPGASETEADASEAGSGRSSTEANGSARDERAFNTPETTQTEGCPHRSLRAPAAGPESKDADEATYDGETVTVVSRRGNVCIIEGGDGGRSSEPTDELDFHADVPF